MKFARVLMLSTALAIMLLSAACFTIYKGPDASSQVRPDDQFVSEWSMTRTGISPAVPIPDIVLNQIVSDKATWKISRLNSQMKIEYDGRDTWYRPLGFDVQKKQVKVAEDAANKSVSFTGGGTINMGSLPAILSAVFNRKMEQFTINFDDNALIKLTSATRIAATITCRVQGKYLGDMEFSSEMKWKTLDWSGTFTYAGTKK
jgi:hypothetical protein